MLKGRKYLCFLSCLLLVMAIGGQVLAADGTSDTPVGLDVVVVEDKPGDGSEKAGYKVDKVKNFGFWGEKSQLDMPYTTFIISEELMENLMATDPDVLSKMIPYTGIDISNVQTNVSFLGARGFSMNSAYLEGLRLGTSSGIYLDDKSGAEVLTGFGGFMFGMGTGSTLNYNLKRSTSEYLNKITVTGLYHGTGKIHADLGGPLPFLNNKFGYRFNVSFQDGETNYENQYIRQFFISQTFDFKPTNRFYSLLNFSYGDRKFEGYLGQFNTWDASLRSLPDVPSGRHIWAPKGTYNEYKDYNVTWGMKWEATDWLQVRAGYNYKRQESEALSPGSLDFTNASGVQDLSSMRFLSTNASAPGHDVHSYGIYTTAKVETFGIKHTATLGSNGYRLTNKVGIFRNPDTGALINYLQDNNHSSGLLNQSSASSLWLTGWFFNMGDWKGINNLPVRDLLQYFTGERRKTSIQENYNIMIGDEVKITDQWIVFAGVNRSQIVSTNWAWNTRLQTSKYDEYAWTPTFSVMYKPIPNVTFYATYIEALEQGTIVGAGYKNAGEILEPMKSEQYEAGIKYEIPNGALLSLALFQIDKALTYSSDGTSTGGTGILGYDGRQVHTGIEAGVQGRLWNYLTLMGGFVYLDPQIKKTNNATTRGKEPSGVPNWIAKTYAELDIPWVEGLTLTGGAYYNGSTWCDAANLNRRSGYVIADLGARYKMKIYGVDTTFRLNIGNITNEKQWAYTYVYPARSAVLSVSTSF